MTLLMSAVILSFAVVASIKAVTAARLSERDPEAFERWQRAEFERFRRRQEMLGKAMLYVIGFVSSLVKPQK